MIEKLRGVRARQLGMDMDVDQAREQRPAAHVDDLGVGDMRRTAIDRSNPAVLDYHVAILAIAVRGFIQNAGILEYRDRQLVPRSAKAERRQPRRDDSVP